MTTLSTLRIERFYMLPSRSRVGGVLLVTSVAAFPLALIVVGVAAVALIALCVVAAAVGVVRAIDRSGPPWWPPEEARAIDVPRGPLFDQFMSPQGVVVDTIAPRHAMAAPRRQEDARPVGDSRRGRGRLGVLHTR
jgi:hypothetical protein